MAPYVVGRYAMCHELATGGMATVHLGKMCGPVGFSPIVAIKCLHPFYAKDPEFAQMFLDEARLAARVRHPNIVPVIDVHAEPQQLYLVLEYVHGESLGRLIMASQKADWLAPPSIACAIMSDVLHGLHAAHEARDERGRPLGIVHRDVSPQNILVGVDGIARVFDFGVAKAAGRVQTTRDGQLKGKLAYMSPEQLRGDPISRQADVYAAAVVLWEMLTGERLFKADSEGSTVARALFGPVPSPRVRRPDIPPPLEEIVMRGLARETSVRFASAEEMALALEAAVPHATAPEVAAWTTGLARDAIQKRAALVAEIEALELSAVPPPVTTISSPVMTSGGTVIAPAASASARAPIFAPPEDGSTVGHAMSERPRSIDGSGGTPARGRLRGALTVLGGAALMLLGFWFGLRGRPTPAAAAGAEVTTTEATTASPPLPASSPATAAATTIPATTPPATAIAPATETATVALAPPAASQTTTAPSRAKLPARAPRKTTPATTSLSSPASGDRCMRRNADGVIEFDTACLRESQRAP